MTDESLNVSLFDRNYFYILAVSKSSNDNNNMNTAYSTIGTYTSQHKYDS